LGSIQIPALVLVGEEDAASPPEVAREMSEAIPNARLQVLAGAGHFAHAEQPEAWATPCASSHARLARDVRWKEERGCLRENHVKNHGVGARPLYFALQGASGVVWWAILLLVPPVRELSGRGCRAVASMSAAACLRACRMPWDYRAVVGCALSLARGSRMDWTLLCPARWALGYATLFCLNLALSTRGRDDPARPADGSALAATTFWMWKLRPHAAPST
jgi:hypothetical protein